MTHYVYVLTPDPEGFCNPDDWLEAFPCVSDAAARALQITAEEVENECVGDPQYSDPPPLPGAGARCWSRLRPTNKPNIQEVTTYTEDMDENDSAGFRSFLIFKLQCPREP